MYALFEYNIHIRTLIHNFFKESKNPYTIKIRIVSNFFQLFFFIFISHDWIRSCMPNVQYQTILSNRFDENFFIFYFGWSIDTFLLIKSNKIKVPGYLEF